MYSAAFRFTALGLGLNLQKKWRIFSEILPCALGAPPSESCTSKVWNTRREKTKGCDATRHRAPVARRIHQLTLSVVGEHLDDASVTL